MIKNKNRYIIKKYRMLINGSYPYSSKINITRQDIYKLFEDFDYKIGAEIGVYRGSNAYRICKQVPNVKLFCIDPWSLGRRYERYYQMAQKKLENFDTEFMRMTSIEAVPKIQDKSLDFVYIDAGFHYFDDVIIDLILWSKKIKPGGIISGHDYEPHCGVVRAVDTYTAAHGISPYYITADRNRSFFWVK